MTYPVALSIAGSDPSGGAGIQADLRTFQAHGVFGAAVISLLTVQNTVGVREVQVVGADLVKQQLHAVLEDLPVSAIKTGALGNGMVVESICEVLASCNIPLVVDPIILSTNGHELFDPAALDILKRELFPRALLVTPNIAEASLLSAIEIVDETTLMQAGDRKNNNITTSGK